MKLWLKASPDITAETLSDSTDEAGGLPVKVHNPRNEIVDYWSVILPSEWSTVEIVPAPVPVPDEGYLVLYGEDPARTQYEFHPTQLEAAVAAAKKNNAFGYVAVTVYRNAMIPVE